MSAVSKEAATGKRSDAPPEGQLSVLDRPLDPAGNLDRNLVEGSVRGRDESMSMRRQCEKERRTRFRLRKSSEEGSV